MSAPFADRIRAGAFLLRPYVEADAPQLLRMMDDNRQRLLRNFAPTVNAITSLETSAAFITERAGARTDHSSFTYGIWQGQALAGQITVKNIGWAVPSAELSYFVSQDHVRRGVASAAVRAILHEAFAVQGFKRVFARIITSNSESRALAEKLGFRDEAVHRNDFRCGYGELHDVHYFALTDTDYSSRTAG